MTATVTTTSASTTGALKGDFKPSGTAYKNIPYFDCDSDTFYKCIQGKRRGAHWKTFMGDTIFGNQIKGWVSQNRTKNFMLRNKNDGSYIFAHKVI